MAEKKSVLDLIREEKNRKTLGSILSRFVLLREPGSLRLRFLDDLEGKGNVARTAYIHVFQKPGRREPPERILCEAQFNRPCKYCRKNDPRLFVFLRVFDYESKTVRILELRPGSDAMDDLLNYYEEYKSITDADYIYKRVGTGLNDTRYSLIRKEKSEFKFKKSAKATWISDEEVEQIIKDRYGPSKDSDEED